jgi:hypothetical protein
MPHSSPARWLAVPWAVAALSATAQPLPVPADTAPTANPPIPTYKSAFEGYRPFADEKPIPWKEANETVRRRGGGAAPAAPPPKDRP